MRQRKNPPSVPLFSPGGSRKLDREKRDLSRSAGSEPGSARERNAGLVLLTLFMICCQSIADDAAPPPGGVTTRQVAGFHLAPRRTVVVAPEASWAFGSDFDRDGIADLAAVTGDRVSIEIGADGAEDDEDDARGLGRPRLADLDGDGHAEILLQGEVGGRAVLRVIELR